MSVSRPPLYLLWHSVDQFLVVFCQDKAVGLCRFLVALGETHSKILLGTSKREEQQISTIFISLILVSFNIFFD